MLLPCELVGFCPVRSVESRASLGHVEINEHEQICGSVCTFRLEGELLELFPLASTSQSSRDFTTKIAPLTREPRLLLGTAFRLPKQATSHERSGIAFFGSQADPNFW